MRIVQLKTQQQARALRADLFPPDMDQVARQAREAELKRMNPDVDVEAIDVGHVLVVPDYVTVAGEATHGLARDDAAALAERAAPVRATLERVLAEEADERERIRRDLSGKAVRDAVEENPALAQEVERVRDRLTQDARDAKVREDQLTDLVDRATADFEALQRRFGLA